MGEEANQARRRELGVESVPLVTDELRQRPGVGERLAPRMYHYVQEGKITWTSPVLIVYAFVNLGSTCCLQPDRSLIRKLLQKGLDIYIIDWGYPTKQDMYVTLDDYIDEYINDCVDFITKTTPARKVNLMGICQGGTFSTMYAALYPEKVQNLVTLVTPIDFDTHDALLFSWSDYMDADKVATYRVVSGRVPERGLPDDGALHAQHPQVRRDDRHNGGQGKTPELPADGEMDLRQPRTGGRGVQPVHKGDVPAESW